MSTTAVTPQRRRCEPPTCPSCSVTTWALHASALRDRTHDAPGHFTVWRCESCGLLRLWPVPGDVASLYPDDYYSYCTAPPGSRSPSQALLARAKYSALAVTWRAGFSTSPLLRWPASVASRHSSTLRELRHYATRPCTTLLDVGCGAGEFLSWARVIGLTVRGLELDDVIARRVQARGIECDGGGLESLKHDQRRYDVVRACHALEHMEDPAEALGLVHEHLATGVVWRRSWYRMLAASYRGLSVPTGIGLTRHDTCGGSRSPASQASSREQAWRS